MHVAQLCRPFFLGEHNEIEKMDMLRHDYVTDDYELMALADLLQNFEEEIARAGCPEHGDGVDNNLW